MRLEAQQVKEPEAYPNTARTLLRSFSLFLLKSLGPQGLEEVSLQHSVLSQALEQRRDRLTGSTGASQAAHVRLEGAIGEGLPEVLRRRHLLLIASAVILSPGMNLASGASYPSNYR